MGLSTAIKTRQDGYESGAPKAADLAIINRWAATGKEVAAEAIFVFATRMANAELCKDRPWSFGESSLKNFAQDAGKSVPYQIQHERYGRVGGYTYAGHYDGKEREARAAIFLQRGVIIDADLGLNTDTEIADIESGLRRYVSVGPTLAPGAQMICSVCGKDMRSWDCPHLPGRIDKETGKLVTASFEGLRLAEVSGVDNGAVPGAQNLLAKAEHLLRCHTVDDSEIAEWCDNLKLPSPVKHISTSADTTPRKERKSMSNPFATVFSRKGMTHIAASILGNKSEEPEDVAESVAVSVQTEVEQRVKDNPLIKACAESGIETPEQLAATIAQAKDGESYVSELRTSAKQEAVRLYGAEKGKTIGATVDHLPAATVKEMRDGWKTEADAKFGVGDTRKSAPTELPRISAASAEDNGQEDAKERRVRLLNASPLGKKLLAAGHGGGNGKGG